MVYKVVTKVLANRFKGALCHVISSEQSAFVLGCLIFDNVIVAYEAIHTLQRKIGGKVGFVALMLDMSKAYNRMEWKFLFSVMRRVGFSEQWVVVVRDCLESVSFSFIINGSPHGLVIPTRGIHQGCLLSPYLFL